MRAHHDHEVWQEIAPRDGRGGFRPAEFNEPYEMDVAFLRRLWRLRQYAGVPLRPVSDVRPPDVNEEAGGATGSAHLVVPGIATDLQVRSNFERYRVLHAALVGDTADVLSEIVARVDLPADLRDRAERALSDRFERVGIYPPTTWQRNTYGTGSGSVHLDMSDGHPHPRIWTAF